MNELNNVFNGDFHLYDELPHFLMNLRLSYDKDSFEYCYNCEVNCTEDNHCPVMLSYDEAYELAKNHDGFDFYRYKNCGVCCLQLCAFVHMYSDLSVRVGLFDLDDWGYNMTFKADSKEEQYRLFTEFVNFLYDCRYYEVSDKYTFLEKVLKPHVLYLANGRPVEYDN